MHSIPNSGHNTGWYMRGDRPFLCSFCFQPIDLNSCKIDEDGRAVHENCYAIKVASMVAQKKRPSGFSLFRKRGKKWAMSFHPPL